MQLQLATLCDSAADYQGKLCVLGAFDTLCAAQFPVIHPQCSLAIRLLFKPEDAGRHELSIELKDGEGRDTMPAFKPHVDVVFPPGVVPFVTRNLVLNLQRLQFSNPGVYTFNIGINGNDLIVLPIRVSRFDEIRAANSPAG